ncbi:MAG: Cupin domain protein [Dehalococcoidia bacterium]|nr:Cupin domain protein [Dehalococcoidia bacterium]MBF8304445.1 Cupin domain protein [Dehalococcoidia bacterium]
MTERVTERRKEPEPQELIFEYMQEYYRVRREQGEKGTIVLKGKDIPWEQNRQGLIRFYTHPQNWKKLAVPGWSLFVHHIKKQGGRHTHQGGLGLFVLDGKGYTIVDGTRFDWEKDDLILLPMKPGGCEHQHFNLSDKPSSWLAFIFNPFWDASGNLKVQSETSPDWKGPNAPPPVVPHVS